MGHKEQAGGGRSAQLSPSPHQSSLQSRADCSEEEERALPATPAPAPWGPAMGRGPACAADVLASGGGDATLPYGCATAAGTVDAKLKENQDAWVAKEHFLNLQGLLLLGVFDGHGPHGRAVACELASRLPGIVAQHAIGPRSAACEGSSSTWDFPEGHAWLEAALQGAVPATNLRLSQVPGLDTSLSGATGTVAVVGPGLVTVANLGDCRCVIGTAVNDMEGASSSGGSLCAGIQALDLSTDHTPFLLPEALRVLTAQGRIATCVDQRHRTLGPPRVWLRDRDVPGVCMTRAWGISAGRPAGIIDVPDVATHHLRPEDRFLLIVSDGVTQVMSSQDMVEVVQAAAAAGQPPHVAAAHLIWAATARWDAQEAADQWHQQRHGQAQDPPRTPGASGGTLNTGTQVPAATIDDAVAGKGGAAAAVPPVAACGRRDDCTAVVAYLTPHWYDAASSDGVESPEEDCMPCLAAMEPGGPPCTGHVAAARSSSTDHGHTSQGDGPAKWLTFRRLSLPWKAAAAAPGARSPVLQQPHHAASSPVSADVDTERGCGQTASPRQQHQQQQRPSGESDRGHDRRPSDGGKPTQGPLRTSTCGSSASTSGLVIVHSAGANMAHDEGGANDASLPAAPAQVQPTDGRRGPRRLRSSGGSFINLLLQKMKRFKDGL